MYIQEKGFSRFNVNNESEALLKYGKTITMIVLARVNGYYSPYFPQSIMEEEDRCVYGTNFSYAEKDFFSNKLMKMSPNISAAAVREAIDFLERQKEANCPCTIHTQKRGNDWIVFNKMPDRVPSSSVDKESTMSDSDDTEEFFNVADTTTGSQEAEATENMEADDSNNNVETSGTSSSEIFNSADLTAGYHSIFNPTVSNSPCDSGELSLNSRDDNHIRSKKNDSRQRKTKKSPTKNKMHKSNSGEEQTEEDLGRYVI